MKILFISLGCDKNLVDSEEMLGLLNSRGYTFTDDETEADVIIRPYNWEVNGKRGVAAYLVSLFAHVQVDELEEKYSSYGVDYESEGPDGYDA